MSEKLRRIPFFVFLLPIFFVLHGVLENFGFISFKDASVLLLTYIGLTLVIGSIFWLLLWDLQNAAIITIACMAFFFFYEAFMQLIKKLFPYSFFTSYTFLLIIALLAIVVLFIYLRKSKKNFPRLYLFLNVALILYLLIDTGWLFLKLFYPPANPLSVYSFRNNKNTPHCDTCKKSNVYFLLFDEYASSISLKEQFNYDNIDLDTFLLKQGFHINRQSTANYNFTPFSMASVLNMSYIDGIQDPRHLVAQDFTNTDHLIRNNQVIKIFSSLGYELKIYSIFDLAGNPAKAWQSFLPLKTRLITERTLAARLNTSINFLLAKKLGIKHFVMQAYMKYYLNNENFLQLVEKEAKLKTTQPKFLYAHFIMPHFPYLFDSAGRRKSDQQIYKNNQMNTPAAYLSYLQYTNKRLKTLVQHIRQNDSSAVILLCGDHGFRRMENRPPSLGHFQNLNAVYFPDHDYSRWSDNVSFVNEFRITFNQLFQFNYPLLKDSTIFLGEQR